MVAEGTVQYTHFPGSNLLLYYFPLMGSQRHLYRLERGSSHGGNLIHNKFVLGSILDIQRIQLLEEIEDA